MLPTTSVTPAPGAPCRAGPVGARATALLVPILRERIAAYRQEFNSRGEYQGESPHSREFDKLFYSLLDNHLPEADEALAVLPHVYLGEHAGEELECEIIHRGGNMLSRLETFRQCLPTLLGLTVPRQLLEGLPDLYPDLIVAIKMKEKRDRD